MSHQRRHRKCTALCIHAFQLSCSLGQASNRQWALLETVLKETPR